MSVMRIRRCGVIRPVPFDHITPHVYRHVPQSFQNCCRSARLGVGYLLSGYQLTSLSEHLIPEDCSTDDWLREKAELGEHIAAGDSTAMLNWFIGHYPGCMALIPPRRYDCFLRGVFQHVREREPTLN
jgi:hypothetical protein